MIRLVPVLFSQGILHAEQPNIVVMLSDDMGWGQVGCQGGSAIPTPNIDRIAIEGIRLTQFYVQPVCTPTRSAFLTGRYPFRTGTETRVSGNDIAGMLLDERTLAQALHDAGYLTAIVGKWHLGSWKKEHPPMQRGFEHQYGHYGASIDYARKTRGAVYDWHRNEKPIDEEGYSTELIAKETVRLITEHDGGKPAYTSG
jgi:arylsulfatase A-like enzyme